MKFIIDGIPVGKGRPRFSSRGGFARAYSPSKTREYEEYVKACYKEQCNIKPTSNALEICIDAYYPVPKATTKANRSEMLAGTQRPTKKPDADNIAKVIMDALNEAAYIDDKQVVDLHVKKWYAAMPRVEVEIRNAKDI